MAAPRLAFAVISRGRPEGLGRLIDVLDRQVRALPPLDCDLRVVLNQALNPAYGAALESPGRLLQVRWRLFLEPGIPAARNALVEWLLEEPPEACVFLDDDEVPQEGWLQRLLSLWQQHPETILTGPVVAISRGSSTFLLRHAAFSRVRRLPSGAATNEAYTNNTLVPFAVLQALGPSFDKRFTRTGGSDTEWFRRAHRAGFPIRYFHELVVLEEVDGDRLKLSSLLTRWLRNGTTDTLIRRRQQPGPGGLARIVARGTGRTVAGLAGTAAFALLLRPEPMLRALNLALSGVGSLVGLLSISPRQY
jgi:hypothetical protein